jgi:glutathione S-transferase
VYDLHIGNKNYSSWSLRPWLLLRELGVPFTEKLHVFGRGTIATVSPSGRVPCLVDGSTVVWDSLAIAEYVAEQHPTVWPADRAARAWARSAAAEMHSSFGALRSSCAMSVGLRVTLKAPSAALKSDLARLDALWTEGLTRFKGPFLAGNAFTAVDAFFAPVAFRIQTYGLTVAGPGAQWVQRLLARPSMQEWQRDALAEPFRDAPHEKEILEVGTVTADLRVPAA